MATITSEYKKLLLFIIAIAKDEDEAEEQIGELTENILKWFSEILWKWDIKLKPLCFILFTKSF